MIATKRARVHAWDSGEYKADQLSEEFVEFRLVYEGPLESGANNPRPKEKHAVPKALHRQLAALWAHDAGLQELVRSPGLEKIANDYARCGYRFAPVVSSRLKLVCALDILFLRRESPGQLVQHGGDIDGRLKTLFDALCIPVSCNQLPSPEPGEDPFFCLLEDDHLITGFQITTDQLLRPSRSDEAPNDVVLIIHVKVKATMITIANIGLTT